MTKTEVKKVVKIIQESNTLHENGTYMHDEPYKKRLNQMYQKIAKLIKR